MIALPKRRNHPQFNSEELRRTPKKAKFHQDGVVPMAFFHQAVDDPNLFFQSIDHSQIGSEESAPSPSNGDHQKPTSVSVSISGPSQSGIEGNSRPSPSNGTGDQPMSASTSSPSGKEAARVRRFGWYSEALLRDCYTDLVQEIHCEIEKRNESIYGRTLLLELRGSAGIGKSAFLAYLMAAMKISGLKDFALFHAPVGSERSGGVNEVLCSVWIDGKLEMDSGEYGIPETQIELQKLVPKLEAMFMDGCSMGFSIENFDGVIFVAASPSVCTENLQKALSNNYTTLYMPPWSLDEAIVASDFLNVQRGIAEENYSHMRGIARYLFEKDSAKTKVQDAVKKVNPQTIRALVASNEKESAMVHSLVLWQPELKENGKYDHREMVRFELVSRYAEQKVAEKLSKFDLALLLSARLRLSPVSGAEGYAGALFEGYAINKISGGGTFNIFSLEKGKEQVSMEIEIPSMHGDPVVVECNTLSPSTVPLDSVHVKADDDDDDDDSWQAKVLWPLTSNFPTFDCFYFHTDGEIYPLQMTIATIHELRNTGAYQTMKYLEEIETCKRPYKAVFVCPCEKYRIKRQKFTGSVKDGKRVLFENEAATEMMDETFEQWVLPI